MNRENIDKVYALDSRLKILLYQAAIVRESKLTLQQVSVEFNRTPDHTGDWIDFEVETAVIARYLAVEIADVQRQLRSLGMT